MNFLLDPNIAFVLLAIAFMVTIFALLAPGTGVLEIISLMLLSLVGFTVANMPVNTWAIVLLVGGILSIIITLKRSENQFLIAISILLLVAGMLTIFREKGQMFAMDPFLAFIVSVSLAAFIWIIGRNTTRAFNQRPQQDLDRLIGQNGRAVTDIANKGSVYVDGENWSAVSDAPIKKDSTVIIRQRDGLVLKVEEFLELKKD